MPAHIGKRNRRRQAAGIAQCGEFRMRRIVGNSPIGVPGRALCAVEPGFELGDQVLDAIDLARGVGGPLALAG